MKGTIWSINISTDFIHNFTTRIVEIHIPDLNIAYNIYDGNANVFKYDSSREVGWEDVHKRLHPSVCLGEIKIADDFAKVLKDYIEIKETVEGAIKAEYASQLEQKGNISEV